MVNHVHYLFSNRRSPKLMDSIAKKSKALFLVYTTNKKGYVVWVHETLLGFGSFLLGEGAKFE